MLWVLLIACDRPAPPEEAVAPLEEPALAVTGFAGSASCASCHPDQTAGWQGSHHALAQRSVGEAEAAALAAHPQIRRDGDGFVLGDDALPVIGVLGVEPLWQPLVGAADGRVQVFDEGYDVATGEWFSVFEEPREPGEWGHWTGRGMTWNTMCGECHNTGFAKGYAPASDTFQTAVVEEGVGCEACHGPAGQHVADPTQSPSTPDEGDCAACHSRRATLTEDTGGGFDDRYALLSFADGALFYPDGQIRDEVFEHASFRSSRMHEAGVTCGDCHDAHSGQLLRQGDSLCLSCHADHEGFALHDHHEQAVGCVDCHMPQTTYMQRHPRRDHGFIVPDPGLTLAAGVPNACERCHDEGAAWALSHTSAWFGDELTPRQQRARFMAGLSGLDGLIAVAGDDNATWRAAAMEALIVYIAEPAAAQALLSGATDEDPLVRQAAITTLSARLAAGEPTVVAAVRVAQRDTSRSVRLAAARALRQPSADLLAYLDHNADQPSALLERASYLMDTAPDQAAPMLRQVIEWDGSDPQARMALAVVASRLGDHDEAGVQLRAVTALAPEDASGWYMLGLHHNGQGRLDEALAALQTAEDLDAVRVEAPFARATILRDAGRLAEAQEAAAVAAERGHPQAAALLRSLATPGSP